MKINPEYGSLRNYPVRNLLLQPVKKIKESFGFGAGI